MSLFQKINKSYCLRIVTCCLIPLFSIFFVRDYEPTKNNLLFVILSFLIYFGMMRGVMSAVKKQDKTIEHINYHNKIRKWGIILGVVGATVYGGINFTNEGLTLILSFLIIEGFVIGYLVGASLAAIYNFKLEI